MDNEIAITAVSDSNQMGEGPHWEAKKQILYYVNIFASEVHSYCPETGDHHCATVGDKPVTFIVPVANEEDKFIISYGSDLEIIDWNGRSSTVSRKHYLSLLPKDEGTRMNDAKASPSGILFAGSMGIQLPDGFLPPNMGKLFLIKNGETKILLDSIGIGNGLAWNEGETKMYFNDTLADKTFVYDYDRSTSNISNERVILDFIACKVRGRPDGMTIDVEGNLWIACFEGNQVLKVCPRSGDILQRIQIPSLQVTSCAFGGPKCEDLYVTTAAHLIPEDEFVVRPDTGRLFRIQGLGVHGYPGVAARI